MVEGFANLLIRFRYLVVVLSVVWVAAAASGGRFLSFTNDYRVFFSDENPQLLAFEELQNTYTKNDNILFVLTPKGGEVFAPEVLTVVEQLTAAAWQIPYSLRVDSVTNFQYTYADADDLVVGNLVEDALTLTPAQLAEARAVALHEPSIVNRILSPSAHVTAVNVTIYLPEDDVLTAGPQVVQFARQLAAETEAKHPEIEVRLTGMIMMNNAFAEASQADMKSLVPVMFALVLLLLAVSLKTVSGTLATAVVILLAIVSAMGITGWFGIRLTPPTTSAPTVIMTIAVAHCVHILTIFMQHLYHSGDKRLAMVESLRLNFQPIFITSVTTAVGFLSMNFSDAPPFRDLGNIVSIGVVTGYVLSMTLLPALVMILPVRQPKVMPLGTQFMVRVGEFVVKQRRQLMWSMAALIVVLAAFIPANELNDKFVNYFDESIPFRLDTDYTTENLTGLYQISYSLGAGQADGISEPVYLQRLEAFANWYRAQPEVLHVSSFSDVMKRLNKNLHDDDQLEYRVPQQRDLAAQYLLLYEMSLPFGLDLNNQINVDKSASRFDVTLKTLSTNELLALEDRAQTWLQENTSASMQVSGASPTIMFAYIGYRNVRSMLTGTTVALVLISFVLILALRSVKIGLISLIPNLVPAAMAFGLWGMFVGEVGLALSVVIGMTLGIVVDDTVHFLSKYLRARKEKGFSSPDAVRYAFSTVGMALWITSLALVAGFMVLSLSAFELNAGMGLLTAITIVFALLADFLFLPPLLMKIEENRDVR